MKTFICSCDKTIPLDEKALTKALDGEVHFATQLCRLESEKFKGVKPDFVTCTQEALLFQELHETVQAVNIREMAGWSSEAKLATPKIAALIKAAQIAAPPIKTVTLESKGVCLIYGRDETAFTLANRLKDTLDVTVVLLSPKEITPPFASDYPVVKGKITHTKGVLGNFEFNLDDYALPSPSSRGFLTFGETRQKVSASSDLFIDISGEKSFFPSPELREGYLRAAPNDTLALEKIITKASGLVGVFDKPHYIDFTTELCAHSRSKITGCTRCLDLCPTGAITPNGDSVLIDAAICAGCGACAAACPTGAASYALPSSETLMRKLQVLLEVYATTGGKNPELLFYNDLGEELIALHARFGEGLPAHVLPVRVNELSQLGLEVLTASFAYGAAGVTLLTREKYAHSAELHALMALCEPLLQGLGYGENRVKLLQTDDPSKLVFATQETRAKTKSQFAARGAKRGLLELSLKELHAHAPTPQAVIALPKNAPFGAVNLNEAACTLCLSCVSACPVSALTDNSEQPMLRFTESLCVQCGLCAQTCPEDALTLSPQIDFEAWQNPKRLLKTEEPFHCVSCAKPFGVKSTIEKVQEKLKSHWMFTGDQAGRLRTLAMCEDCRVTSVMNESFDPHAKQRPKPRTAEDYQ